MRGPQPHAHRILPFCTAQFDGCGCDHHFSSSSTAACSPMEHSHRKKLNEFYDYSTFTKKTEVLIDQASMLPVTRVCVECGECIAPPPPPSPPPSTQPACVGRDDAAFHGVGCPPAGCSCEWFTSSTAACGSSVVDVSSTLNATAVCFECGQCSPPLPPCAGDRECAKFTYAQPGSNR